MGAASNNKSPKSIMVLIALTMASLFILQYLQHQSSSFLWAVAQIVISTTIVGLYGLFLWIFRDLNVFVGWNRYTLARLCLVTFSFVIYFTLVSRGFSFLFNGLINPNLISMTPEFLTVVLPTLSGLVVAAYRLTNIFRSKVLDVIHEIMRDIVMFSLLMFWLGTNVSIVGLNISADTSFLSMETAIFLGVLGALICLSVEGFLLWMRNDLQRTGRGGVIESFLYSILPIITPPPKTREKLDDFLPIQSPKSEGPTIHVFDGLNEILNEHFSLRYRRRILKASEIFKVTSVCCIFTIALASFFLPYKTYTAVVPAYSVEVSVIPKSDLPHAVTFVASEDMRDLSEDTFYALQMVLVQYQNGSFETPISERLISANSSNFLVIGLDKYLLIHLTKIAVETEVRDYAFRQARYNYTGDSGFRYIGFNREAEIFYCMSEFGYNEIITFSEISGAEIVTVQKLIFGNSTNAQTARICIFQRIDIFIIEDYIQITSLDETFINQVMFLVNQTKIDTNCYPELKEPIWPFNILP